MNLGIPERILHIPAGLVNLVARAVEQPVALHVAHLGRPPVAPARRGAHDDRGIPLRPRRNALDGVLLEDLHVEELLRRTVELVDMLIRRYIHRILPADGRQVVGIGIPRRHIVRAHLRQFRSRTLPVVGELEQLGARRRPEAAALPVPDHVVGRMDRHGEGGSGNVAVGAIVYVDAQQVARARRHDDIPVGQHLGRVGVSARLGVEHRLLVRNADQRHAAARSRDEHARTVVDRFGLVGQIEPRLFRSEKLLKISKVSYAWKTYRKHFSRSLDFVEIIPRPRLVPL